MAHTMGEKFPTDSFSFIKLYYEIYPNTGPIAIPASSAKSAKTSI